MPKKRILLCEDDHSLNKMLSAFLQSQGFFVAKFDSADGALGLGMEALKDFDVLLTDVEMPGTCGIELAGKLRSQSDELLIFLMSGHFVSPGIIHDLEAMFLSKPFLPSHLLAEIASQIQFNSNQDVLKLDYDCELDHPIKTKKASDWVAPAARSILT